MQIDEMRAVLDQVSYKDWEFDIEPVPDYLGRPGPLVGAHYLQVRLYVDADHRWWTGRKWLLSQHMTESELVQTALKAVLTAEEHEAREHFTYKGRAVFGPHLQLDALIEACDRGALDVRA